MHVGLVSLSDIDYGIDLANALASHGAAVTLYLSRSHFARAMGSAASPEEKAASLGIVSTDVRLRVVEFPRMRDPRSLSAVLKIRSLMRQDGVDVAHLLVGSGELWLAALASLLRGIPVASTMIIPRPNVGDSPGPRVVLAVNALLGRSSDVTIVNGEDQVEYAKRTYGLPPERVRYVPLGPRTTIGRWRTRDVPEEPNTVLFFGRVEPHKGLDHLIEAAPRIAKRIPGARFVIAGRGSDLDRCRALIEDSARFEIHDGFVPNEMAAELFQRASLVCLPYVSASTSGVLVMAYVFGKPVVVTRVGSLPEYVDDGVTGRLVAPADDEALADAVADLLSDDALRHSMGTSCLEWVRKKESEAATRTISAYQDAIAMHFHRGTAGLREADRAAERACGG